ncbi:MAG: DUF4956 domain-containing protein [Ruminococcaceae bacterium]|nr:DUF4956 domain-containing protein [Oscillospiraceae bacterium]
MTFENLFQSVITSGSLQIKEFAICTLTSLLLGALIAFVYTIHNKHYSRSFLMTIAVLPVAVQGIISMMTIQGTVGAGIAVAGAFSLVRYRSVPGSAKEICNIFMAMALGFATAVGYIAYAIIFAVIICVVNLIFNCVPVLSVSRSEKMLRVSIPESLDYTEVFDDIFEKYTIRAELVRVKSTNMGAVFQLSYEVRFKHGASEKDMLDEIRCRNGNLDIILARIADSDEKL